LPILAIFFPAIGNNDKRSQFFCKEGWLQRENRGVKVAFKQGEQRAAKDGRREFQVSHSTQCPEKKCDLRQPSIPSSNLLCRFFKKEFGSSWEAQYKEYEEFWKDYFFAHTLN
jgi:hypothetical protein